tara:strand:- start:611 stop:754 length:144 start_codon:yes stop_codon:yes gene_type:complete
MINSPYLRNPPPDLYKKKKKPTLKKVFPEIKERKNKKFAKKKAKKTN